MILYLERVDQLKAILNFVSTSTLQNHNFLGEETSLIQSIQYLSFTKTLGELDGKVLNTGIERSHWGKELGVSE